MQDISFLGFEGRRETLNGQEYKIMAKMWLRSGVGVPSDLLQLYTREVDRWTRLATLRSRKRTSADAFVANTLSYTSCKKSKLA